MLHAGTETFLHPSEASPDDRREANAALQDRIARAMERAGGISARRDAPVARAAAEKIRGQR